MPIVTLPTGEQVRFPDGATPEEIDAVVRRDYPGYFAAQDPEFESAVAGVPMGAPTDLGGPSGLDTRQRREDDALKRQLEQSLQLKDQGIDEVTHFGGQKTTAEGMKQAQIAANDNTGRMSDFLIDTLNGEEGGLELGDALVGAAVGGAQRATGGAARWIGNKLDMEGLEKFGREGSEGGAARYEKYRNKDVDPTKMWQGDLSTTVEMIVQESGPMLMMAASAGGLGGVLAKMGVGTLTGAVGAKLTTKIPGLAKWAWGSKWLPKAAFALGDAMPYAAVMRATEAAMESGGSFEEALFNGLSEQDAHDIADATFKGNMALAGADLFQVALIFAKAPKPVQEWFEKLPAKQLMKLPAKVVTKLAKFVGAAIMEGQEEVTQEEIQSWAKGEGFDLSAVLNPIEGKQKHPEAFNLGALTSVAMTAPMMTLEAAQGEAEKNPQFAQIFKKTRAELAADEAAAATGETADQQAATPGETPATETTVSEPLKRPKELEGLEPLPEEEWDESNPKLALSDEELQTEAAHEVAGGIEGEATLAYRQRLAQQPETEAAPTAQQDEADDYIDILADMERENGRTPTVAEAVALGVPESVAKTLLEEESDQKLQLSQAQINEVAAEIAPSVVESGKVPTVAKLAKDRRIGAHAATPLEAQQLAKRVLDRIAIEAEQIIQDVDGTPDVGEAAALGAEGDITDEIIKEEAEKLQQPAEEPSYSPLKSAGPEAEATNKVSAPSPAKPKPKKMSEYTDKERAVINLARNTGKRPRMGDVRREVKRQGLGTISQKEAQQLLADVGDVGIDKGELASNKTARNVQGIHDLATKLNKVPTPAEVIQNAPELVDLTEEEAKKLLNGPKNAPALVQAKQAASKLVSKAVREKAKAQAQAKAEGKPDPFAAIPEENPYGIPAAGEKGAPQERAPSRDQRRADVEAAQESADPKRNEREARQSEAQLEAEKKKAEAEAQEAEAKAREAEAAAKAAERKAEQDAKDAADINARAEGAKALGDETATEDDYTEVEDWADSPLKQEVVEDSFKHKDVKEIIPTEAGAVVRLEDGHEIILVAVGDIELTESGVRAHGFKSLEDYNAQRKAGKVYGARGAVTHEGDTKTKIFLNKGEVSAKDRADKTTIDHEAFHILYKFAFSEKQRLQVLKKVWRVAVKDAKAKGRTIDLTAKEAMADPTTEDAKYILDLAEEKAAEAYEVWHPSQRGLMTILDNWVGRLIGSIELDQIFGELRAGNISIKVPKGATGDAKFQLKIPDAANAGFTQRANTTGSYIGAGLKINDGEVVVDYGAGKGIGTEELKKASKKVYSHEPFYDKEGDFKPDFSDPAGEDVLSALEGKADVVVNNLVLNVVPPDVRANIVKNIGRLLKPGGRAYITTRSASDVNGAKSKKDAKLEKGGWIISPGTPRETYQKGFAQAELEEHVAGILGDGFEVVRSDYGTKGNPQVEVRKLAAEPAGEAVSKHQIVAVNQKTGEKKAFHPETPSRVAHNAVDAMNRYGNDGKWVLFGAEPLDDADKAKKARSDARARRKAKHQLVTSEEFRKLKWDAFNFAKGILESLPEDVSTQFNALAHIQSLAMDHYLKGVELDGDNRIDQVDLGEVEADAERARSHRDLPDGANHEDLIALLKKATGMSAYAGQTETKAFKDWFKNSRVVNAEGQPLVVFHGSASVFEEFDKGELGKTTGAPSAKKGFFFSNDPDNASHYAHFGANVADLGDDLWEQARADFYASEEGHEWGTRSSENQEELSSLESDIGYAMATNQGFLEAASLGKGVPARQDDRFFMGEKFGKQLFNALMWGAPTSVKAMAEKAGLPVSQWQTRAEKARAEHTEISEREQAGVDKIYRELKKNTIPAGPNVMPVYLSMQNPLIVDQKGQHYREHNYNQTILKAKKAGHDGVIFKNTFDGTRRQGGEDVYVVFEPTQIKSATGNRGTFDSNDPNIKHQIADSRKRLTAANMKPGDQIIVDQKLVDYVDKRAEDGFGTLGLADDVVKVGDVLTVAWTDNDYGMIEYEISFRTESGVMVGAMFPGRKSFKRPPETEQVSKNQLTDVARAELETQGPKFDTRLLDDPNFRRYWRKGVIVDEEGNPKILTHGTTDDSVANGRKDWESFRDESGSPRIGYAPPDQLLGPHFAEYHGVANRFAGSEDINGPKTPPFGARVKTFTLAAQRVLDLRNDVSGEFDQYAVASAMIDKVFTGGKNIDLVEKFLRKTFGHFATEAQIKEALDAYRAGKPVKNFVNPKRVPYESMAELIKSNDKFVRLDDENRADYIRRARTAFLRAGYDAIKYYNTAPGEVEGVAPMDRFAYISLKPSDVKSTANDGQFGQTGNYMHQLAHNPAQTNTPQFKRWFANSAVVDKDGNPLVLLHGTTKDFDKFIPTKMQPGIFGLGIYMATLAKVSNTFTSESPTYQTPGGRTIPLYASIQNPVDMDAALDPVVAATLPALIEEIAAGYGITVSAQEIAAAIPAGATAGLAFVSMADVIAGSAFGGNVNAKRMARETVARAFQRSGYDGARQVATDELGGHLDAETREALGIEAEFGEVWIAWAGSPQVKSALGNDGSFGIGEPKIKHQLTHNPEQTNSENFKQWDQGEALRDENGDPLVIGHGSTHTFSVFNLDRTNPNSFFGRAFYSSDSIDDIDANYLGAGGDQLARIYDVTDRLENEWQDMEEATQREILEKYADKDGYNPKEDGDILEYAESYNSDMIYNALDRMATDQVLGENGGQPAIYPLYVRMKKRVYWGGPNSTRLEYTYPEEDENGDFVEQDEENWGGEAGELIRAIQEIINENYPEALMGQAANEITRDIMERAMDYGEIDVADLQDLIGPYVDQLYDEEGTMANGGWIIAEALRSIGYDGIIQDAARQFPGMPNIVGAKHYIVFDPNQLKSALGNNGDFSRQDDDIRHQLNISDMTPEQERVVNGARAKAEDDAKELREFDPSVSEHDIARFEQRRLMWHLTSAGLSSQPAYQLSFPKGDGRDGPGQGLMDDWFEGKDFAFFANSVEARKFQKRLKLIMGEKSLLTIFSAGMEDSGVYYGQESDKWDQAMHLYIDLKRNPEDATDPEILRKLNKGQREILSMAQEIERANTPQLREIKQLADDINASYAAHGVDAQDAGIISNILDNYVNRAWKLKDNKSLSRQDESGGFGTTTRHARQRKLGTILEGWAAGHELLVKGATNNLMLLKNEIARVKEDRALIHKGRRMRLPTGEQDAPFLITHIVPKGYEDVYARISHPNFVYRVPVETVQGVDLKRKEQTWSDTFTTEEFVVVKNLNQKEIDKRRNAFYSKPGNAGKEWIQPGMKVFNSRAEAERWALTRTGNGGSPVRIERRLTRWEKKDLYVPKAMAKDLNRILKPGVGANSKTLSFMLKYNAITKSWILMTSFFHHLAFLRSFYLGVGGASSWSADGNEKFSRFNLRRSYRAGYEMIENMHPELEFLVRNGLTLGALQEFDEGILSQQGGISKALDAVGAGTNLRSKMRELRNRQANFLFKRFGASLKAQAALIEYRRALEKDGRNGTDPREIARRVASLVNADFGGLHMDRMGVSQGWRKALRLIFLAPDWTGSNALTVKRMVLGGRGWHRGTPEEREMYQRFWTGALTKGLAATVIGNMLLAALSGAIGLDDNDDWKKNFEESVKDGWRNLRWLEMDITPLYILFHRAMNWVPWLGEKWNPDDRRRYFSLIGHFRDPLKWATHPIQSAFHKESPLARNIHSLLSGKDWKDAGFTTIEELLGIDDKGFYESRGPGHKPGDRRGGKEQFKTTSQRSTGGMDLTKLPSWLLYNIKATQPVQAQEGWNIVTGEMDAFDALGRAMGFQVSRARGSDVDHISTGLRDFENEVKSLRADGKTKEAAQLRRDNAPKVRALARLEAMERETAKYRKQITLFENNKNMSDETRKARIAAMEDRIKKAEHRFTQFYEGVS